MITAEKKGCGKGFTKGESLGGEVAQRGRGGSSESTPTMEGKDSLVLVKFRH